MKPYILTFSYMVVPRQQMLDFLDTIPGIVRNWRAVESFIIVTSDMHDVSVLSNAIHSRFPSLRFILAEIDGTNSQGWLDRVTWDFINNPRASR